MKTKKVPMRKCSGCMNMFPKKELVRVVKAPDKKDENGNVVFFKLPSDIGYFGLTLAVAAASLIAAEGHMFARKRNVLKKPERQKG